MRKVKTITIRLGNVRVERLKLLVNIKIHVLVSLLIKMV